MSASNRSRLASRALAALTALTLVFALAACGDDDDDGVAAGGDQTTEPGGGDETTEPAGDGYSPGGGDAPAAGDAAVTAADFEFTTSPVAAGAEVSFANADSAPHTVTADDGAFDSGTVAAGESGSFTAPSEAGDYDFYCEIHPDMKATLTVE